MIEKKCNICNSSKYKILFFGNDRLHRIDKILYRVVQCQNCGLVYLNPQPEPEELERYYPRNYGPFQDDNTIFKYGRFSIMLKRIKNWLFNKYAAKIEITEKSNSVNEERIVNYLDFGCGGGSHLEKVRLKHPNWNLYGLDNNKFACELVRKKGFKVFEGDILELDLPNNFFDVINMSHIIEHVADPKGTLIKLNSIMKKGATMIISTPNFDSWAAKIFRKYWYAVESPRHLFLFSYKTLTRLLDDTNFIVKEIEYDKGPEVFIRSIYYLLGKRDLRINPVIWWFLKPFSYILAYFGKTSLMTIYAKKVKG